MIKRGQAGRPAVRLLAPGRRARRRHQGFTLLEILLALALIALLSAALISGAIHLVDQRAQTPEEVFWVAATAAREAALQKDQDVFLKFDDEKMEFVLEGGSSRIFPVAADKDLKIDFLHAASGGGAMLLGGELVETQTQPFVTFYGDGTCSPFRVQIRTTGPARVIAIDPWTCARVLSPSDSS